MEFIICIMPCVLQNAAVCVTARKLLADFEDDPRYLLNIPKDRHSGLSGRWTIGSAGVQPGMTVPGVSRKVMIQSEAATELQCPTKTYKTQEPKPCSIPFHLLVFLEPTLTGGSYGGLPFEDLLGLRGFSLSKLGFVTGCRW